ncbi:DUF885 domain-containing protein [Cognaticolwellia beringensis]|uniref:DUF885 domain-containing protein n=1 Tax=Cognaticolwellia beringensis TaxID=1967665 RepID=A0A222GA84_9GAMM|nr:DUF885 domain-containing protein [Cognaticolwellia beringensis]ASP48632.1 DUF885 domain-containing protein [Cognaticolwellia beringensis]
MRSSIALLGAVVFLSACQPNSSTQTTVQESPAIAVSKTVTQSQLSETKRLNEWFAIKYEAQLQNSPMMLTMLGRKDKYDQIDDMTESYQQEQLAWQAASVDELTANFDYSKLTSEAKMSYDIWLYLYQQAKTAAKFNKHRYIFDQFDGAQASVAQFLINFHRVDELSDMQAYITRIAGISTAITQLLERAKVNAAAGTRPPKFAYEGVIEQSNNLISGIPFSNAEDASDSPLWMDIERKIRGLVDTDEISVDQAQALKFAAKKQLLEVFLPSYQALIAWFESDIVNTVSNPTGVSSQKNGQAFYSQMIEASTTTELTAEEIHNIGIKEVERITNEMITIKERVGFKGDLSAFFDFIKTDEQFFYSNTNIGRQGYITDTEIYLDFINKQLPNYFGILPQAGLVVKRVEAFREQDGAAQHYAPGTPDGSRPGVYYAHLSDMLSMPKNEMEGVAYHEGNPGHHMQISIAQELTSIPQFRTQTSFIAYVEGWGLYAELLAKEMGGYQDDYSDFGRLVNEIWRAVRLVVDTGLHAKGWTEEQAVTYFKEKTPVAEDAIISEIRRYLVLPGQATAYKIGMLKMQELRASAEQKLGDRFDIRGFHDTVLGGGAMPLALLERRVNDWIKSQMTK